MKVIERSGPTMAEWKQEIDCLGCSSRLEIDATDLVDQSAKSQFHWKFICPLCNSENFVMLPVIVSVELSRARCSRPVALNTGESK